MYGFLRIMMESMHDSHLHTASIRTRNKKNRRAGIKKKKTERRNIKYMHRLQQSHCSWGLTSLTLSLLLEFVCLIVVIGHS
jgi:hypothetical protein